MEKLSVIIPVYNSDFTLERCVNSVLSQNLDNVEIILVDDGSKDICAALCDSLASEHQEIKVIHRVNGGLSAARNTGIEASTGKWLSFIDSDDEITPGTLSSNMEWLESNPGTDLLEFPVNVHYGSPDSFVLSFKPETVTGTRVFKHWVENEGYTHCYAWNKIYRRELFDSIRFPQGETFEDAAVCPGIISLCKSVRYSDKGCYLYYKSAGSITLNYTFKYQEPAFRNNLRLLNMITEQGLDEFCRTRLWNVCLNLLTDLYRCKDADAGNLSTNASILNSTRPGLTYILRNTLSFKQKTKAIAAWLFGVKSVCSVLGLKKYS
ncbi:MAG: glycosyltransferase [Bacteroidaceae bacterium]|nr:glycosyltransferase [Bacteroidaceae bacterium]